jgi:putative tryptophan/tyrosine transport system substrate-binding protein
LRSAAIRYSSSSSKVSTGQAATPLVIGPDNFFNTRNHQLAMLAHRYRVPAIFNDRPFAAAGGLVSYGGNITDQ